ncbi:hypothetical protein [Blautia glucerasea]|uniref:hypothetical protein n=1 Tax=Blautia glucerasea TaxID=536633 RepID=UPI001FC8AE7F|nr:hypothetical protein [Blautia glucerasea]
MKKKYLLRLPGNMESNESRRALMRNIWTYIILRRKSVKRKYRHWNRRKNISLLRMKD